MVSGLLTLVPTLFSGIMPRGPDKIADAVMFDVGVALNFKVGRTSRPLTDLERKVVAKIIVDHVQLTNWVIERGPPRPKHITGELAKTARIIIF